MYLRELFAGAESPTVWKIYFCLGGREAENSSGELQAMKDVMELLRAKEQELLKVKRQVEALRVAVPLLREDDDPAPAPGLVAKSNGQQN